ERRERIRHIRWSNAIHGRAEDIGPCFGDTQRQVSTRREAQHTYSLRICESSADRPIDGIEEVITHLQTELMIAGVQERPAETGRTTVLRLQNRISAIDQQLYDGIELIVVPEPWAAVGVQDQRTAAGRDCMSPGSPVDRAGRGSAVGDVGRGLRARRSGEID